MMLLQMLRKSDHQFGDYLVMIIVVVALASIFEAYDSGVDCYQHDEEGQQSRLPPPAAVPLSSDKTERQPVPLEFVLVFLIWQCTELPYGPIGHNENMCEAVLRPAAAAAAAAADGWAFFADLSRNNRLFGSAG